MCLLFKNWYCFAALNKYISILDTRLSKICVREVAGNVAKKVRRLGVPSSSTPPIDAPPWAVKKDQEQQGMPSHKFSILHSVV